MPVDAIFVKMTPTPWIERTFNFDFPLTNFPFVLERLHGTAARMEDLLKFIPNETLSAKPGGKWSIKEHLGHLIDLEDLHNGRIIDFLSKLEVLRAADTSNNKTNEANHNAAEIKILLHTFRENRMNFIDRLKAVDENLHSHTALHPRLNKKIRLIDLAYFVAEHDDHHLNSMRELNHLL